MGVSVNDDIRAALDKHMPNNWTLTESSGTLEVQGVLQATGVVVMLRGSRASVQKVLHGLLWAQEIADRLPAGEQATSSEP